MKNDWLWFQSYIIPTKSFMDQTIYGKSCTVSNAKSTINYYESFFFPSPHQKLLLSSSQGQTIFST